MAVSFGGTQCIKLGSNGDAVDRRLYLTYIRWVGGTTAGHTATVTDTAGNVLFTSEADGANFLDIQPVYQIRNGIVVSALGSGTLYVYIA